MAPRSENEKYFYDPITKSRKLFPSLTDSYSKYLSVIIPAYKEVERCKIEILVFYHPHTIFLVPAMIKDTMEYLEDRQVSSQVFPFGIYI